MIIAGAQQSDPVSSVRFRAGPALQVVERGDAMAAAEPASCAPPGAGSSRHEKSLGLLTAKFVSLLQEAKDGVLDLKAVSAGRGLRRRKGGPLGEGRGA